MTNNVTPFEELFQNYSDRTVALIISFGFSREDARDLTQDTFVRVYQSMDKYRGEAKWAYLKKVATNLALNKIRDDAAQKRDASLTVSGDDELVHLADKKPSPEEQAMVRERLASAHDSIQELPQKKRDCVLLFLGGYSYGEIARILGISEATVKSRLHEARLDLKLKGIELP